MEDALDVLYVQRKLTRWDDLEIRLPVGDHLSLNGPEGSCGCILAYPTREAFDEAHPGEEPFILKTE
jgi:hypothetical protein